MIVFAEVAETNEQTGLNKLCVIQGFYVYKTIPIYEAKNIWIK